MTALSPCPFCGTIPDVGIYPESDESPRGYFCICPVCLANTAASSDRSEATAIWNRRTPPAENGEGSPAAGRASVATPDDPNPDPRDEAIRALTKHACSCDAPCERPEEDRDDSCENRLILNKLRAGS